MRGRFRFVAWTLVLATAASLPAVEASGVNVPHTVVVSDDPIDWTPHVLGVADDQVQAVAQIGNRVYVGGKFPKVQESVTGRVFNRPWLFAYNANTGRIDRTFHPKLDERVYAIAAAPGGGSIYIGGEFHTIGGLSQDFVAKLDATTGALVSDFDPRLYDSVRDVILRAGTLYVAGEFAKVNGLPRLGLAALDPATGHVDPNLDINFNVQRKGPQPFVYKIDVTPDASKLVAIGNFTRVGGLDRTELAVLDLSTTPATVANWKTDRWKAACIQSEDFYTRDVDISPDGSYFVTVSIGYFFPGTLCDTAARWELDRTGSNVQPTWVDSTGGDSLLSVAVTGAAIYVGGHQRWMNNPFKTGEPGPGAVERVGIAALDPINGLPYSWNPGRARGNGVFVQFSSQEGLFLGSDTDQLGGEYHSKLGFFPVAGGTTIPPANPGSLPGQLHRMGYEDGSLVRRHFDGSNVGAPANVATGVDWRRARGAFMLSGTLYTGWDDGNLYARSFDGSSLGPARDLNTTSLDLARVTGLSFDRGRIYYTVRKDRRLFYRYFTAESGIVGAQAFVSSGESDGMNWTRTRGMMLAGGRIYFSSEKPGTAHDGNLYSMAFQNGAPVAGTKRLVSGPDAGDGIDWKARGLFVLST